MKMSSIIYIERQNNSCRHQGYIVLQCGRGSGLCLMNLRIYEVLSIDVACFSIFLKSQIDDADGNVLEIDDKGYSIKLSQILSISVYISQVTWLWNPGAALSFYPGRAR